MFWWLDASALLGRHGAGLHSWSGLPASLHSESGLPRCTPSQACLAALPATPSQARLSLAHPTPWAADGRENRAAAPWPISSAGGRPAAGPPEAWQPWLGPAPDLPFRASQGSRRSREPPSLPLSDGQP